MPAYKDTKRGTWYIKIYTKDSVTGKTKQITKRGFRTRRDALDWEAEQRPSRAAQTSERFIDFANRYYAFNKPKERTKNSQLAMLKKYAPDLIDEPIGKLTKARMMEWYLNFTDTDLKPSTKNLCIGVIRSIFKFASDHYAVPNNAVGLKRVKTGKKKYTTWTPAELEAFLSRVEGEDYKNIYLFMYWTGVRRGEAIALRTQDFDKEKHTVHIHHQLQIYEEDFTPLKTESSERTLKLADPLWEVIAPILDREDGPFVFGGVHPLPQSTLQIHMDDAIRKSGVEKIRIHDLRHSFATNMIGSGANIVAVSKYLGHATVRQTLDTYTHLLEKADDQMVGMVADLMKST